MPVPVESRLPTAVAGPDAARGCGRQPCCRGSGPPAPPRRVALAYGLPTGLALAAAGAAAALQVPDVFAALAVLPALAVAARLAGRVDGERRCVAAAPGHSRSATTTVSEELPCP